MIRLVFQCYDATECSYESLCYFNQINSVAGNSFIVIIVKILGTEHGFHDINISLDRFLSKSFEYQVLNL